jgi:GntR family transcriptional regulator
LALTTIPLDRASSVPLYRQIEDILRQELGHTPDAVQRLTENDLIARFRVSRHTVRQALGRLAAAGLVDRHPKRGTYPSSHTPIEQPLSGVYSFVHSLRQAGADYRATVVSVQVVPSSDGLHDSLRTQGQLVRLERLHRLDEEGVIAETIWLPSERVPEIDQHDLSGSLYDLLRLRYGLNVTSASESIRPVILNRRQSGVLGVEKGLPAFFVERQSFAGEVPVEVRHSLIRGDRYLYSVQLRTSEG